MHVNTWSTNYWPEGVPRDITGYDKPLFSLIDDAAAAHPHQVYTIFSKATRTFGQVQKTANRVANLLIDRGIRKGDRVAIFLPIWHTIRPFTSASSNPGPCASPATRFTPPANSIISSRMPA